MAHRRRRGIALPFHDHGTRGGWGVSDTLRTLFTPGKDPVPIVQEVGWDPGPVWTGAENLASTGIRSPDRTARSLSLYRLRYPAHVRRDEVHKINKFRYHNPIVWILSNSKIQISKSYVARFFKMHPPETQPALCNSENVNTFDIIGSFGLHSGAWYLILSVK